jgi:hypothetical protein
MAWIFDLVRRKLGHWLISDEEADDRRREEERAKKQKEIMDAQGDVEDTARDLDGGGF